MNALASAPPAPRSAIETYLQDMVTRAAYDAGTVQPAQRLLQEELPERDRLRPSYDYPRAVPPMEQRRPNRFGSRPPTTRDRMIERHMYNVADAGRYLYGYGDASRHMRHFLDGDGGTLNPDIRRMIREIPRFGEAVNINLQTGLRAQIEARLAEGARGTFDVETAWRPSGGADDGNWQVALGGFNFAHSARVRAVPLRDGSIDVRVYPMLHVFDRYDWRPGQRTRLLPNSGLGRLVPERLRVIEDADMAALVEAGLAREYEIRGSLRQPELRWRIRPAAPIRRRTRR